MQPLSKLLMLEKAQSLEEAGSSGAGADRLSLSGCLILQAVLAMPQNACKVFTDELAALPAAQLSVVARDASGSRVIESFLQVCHPRLASQLDPAMLQQP